MGLRHKDIAGWRVPVVPRGDIPERHTYRSILHQLCEAQNWRCCYCGVEMTSGVDNKTDCATLEHVLPLSAGGLTSWENLVAACRLCNNSRGCMVPKRFLYMVRRLGREGAAIWAQKEKRWRMKPKTA